MKAQQTVLLAAACSMVIASHAVAQSLAISLGVRETNTSAAIGANGGTAGTIEWIRKDGQFLNLDGSWQQFTFNFGTDPVSAFTGNNALDATRGAFESIRIVNSAGLADPVALYVDDVVHTVGGVDTLFDDFDSYTAKAPQNALADFVMFDNPHFSSSTQSLIGQDDTANVSADAAHSGANSYRVGYQWATAATSNWLRLTTFNTAAKPNPALDWTSGNKFSFWLRGVVLEPTIRWTAAGNGNYSDIANWNNGTVANGTSASANFLSAATANATITIDANVKMNLLRLKNSNSYSFVGSGTNSMTLTGPAGSTANISVELGNHTISAPMIQLDRTLQVTVATGASLTISQPISQQVSGATVNDPPVPVTNLGMIKAGAGLLKVSTLNCGTLTVNDTGTLQIAAGAGTSKINFLSMATSSNVPTGRLDLLNHAVVYDLVDDSTQTTQINTTIPRIKNAFASGSWNGTGVTSSAALVASTTPDHTGIGLATAGDLGINETTFQGVPIVGDAIILKYTLVGDSNLDNKVNTVDFNLLAGNFGGGTDIRWSKGDYDYDGDVDSVDFTNFAANYGKTIALSGPSLGAVVPEPAAMGLLAVAGLATIRRRRR